MKPTDKVYQCMRKAGDESCVDRRATDMTNSELHELIKQAQREGIKEWLDEKYAAFGRWSLMGLSAALFVWLVKFAVTRELI